VIRLDVGTVLLQWATGGLAFLWLTTRRREVGLGYGWLLRGVYGAMALGAFALGRTTHPDLARDLGALAEALAAAAALAVSVQRRVAGVAGQRGLEERRSARVAVMTGIDRDTRTFDTTAAEFPPILDLVAPAVGVLACLAAAADAAAAGEGAAGGPLILAALRFVVGAAFLGAVSDAMLLGHWYLVQPGLPRAPLLEMVRASTLTWPAEVAVMLLPAGMLSVFSGAVDDGWDGILGWMWALCAASTIILLLVTRAALKERQYSAVMAATGLLYLAILTAFGTDLVARAVLSS
jgi:hypothetical protein